MRVMPLVKRARDQGGHRSAGPAGRSPTTCKMAISGGGLPSPVPGIISMLGDDLGIAWPGDDRIAQEIVGHGKVEQRLVGHWIAALYP